MFGYLNAPPPPDASGCYDFPSDDFASDGEDEDRAPEMLAYVILGTLAVLALLVR